METNNELLPVILDTNERFRTIRELGSGTYGRVMLALDRELQQRCALKMLQKSSTKFRDFQREYNYSLLLSPHRSIINTYEDRCFQTTDAYIMVQEYAPLGDLFESIPPQRGLPERAVKTIMKQIASALEFMHDKGLVCTARFDSLLRNRNRGKQIFMILR
jgi:serine/threonine protein kinase